MKNKKIVTEIKSKVLDLKDRIKKMNETEKKKKRGRKKKKKKKRHKNCFLVAIRDAHGVLQAYSREPAFTASDKVQETARNSKII